VAIPKLLWMTPPESAKNDERYSINLLAKFNIKIHCTIGPGRLAHGLTGVLSLKKSNDQALNNLDALIKELPTEFEFATRVVSEKIVLFEPPCSLKSLTEIHGLKTENAFGAALGDYQRGSNPLFLCISVPAGVVICGTGAGMGEALQAG